MVFDLKKALEQIKRCRFIPEADVKELCLLVVEILVEESNVQPIQPPVIVCGDIHGQFFDLLELLKKGGEPGENATYIFMGDFVDRGRHSLETMTYLLLIKALYPSLVTIIRGNHEARQVTRSYGFYDEIIRKYGTFDAWRYFMDVFDVLPIGCIIGGSVLCVHGGLSPDVSTIDHLRMIERCQEVPNAGPFCDILWSDPEDIESWAMSPRGAGWLFGSRVASLFCSVNKLDLITRSHQLAQDGFKYHFEEKNVLTIWSAPNYVYRMGNRASILKLDSELEREVVGYDASEIQTVEGLEQNLRNGMNKP